MDNFEQKIEYGNIDWDIVADILKSDNFILNAKKQHGAYSPVYDQGLIFSEEVINENNLLQKEFVEQELNILKEKYPDLNENYLIAAANLCSRHQSDIGSSIDRDICVITVTEGLNECKETYINALNNLKINLNNYFIKKGTISYDTISYTEDRVLPIVVWQLKNHLIDSSNPLLTWGMARLALAELSNIQIQKEQQRKSSLSF